jgi:hypothetical protein
MALGEMNQVNIRGVSIDGKIRFDKRLRHVNPGRHDVLVELGGPGALYVEFEFVGPKVHKKLQAKVMSLGGGR